MNSGWKQRLQHEREPEYGESKLFTVELHHGGTFGEWGYYDETVDFFDFVDPERFSLMELNRMVLGLLRKEDYMQYLWLPAGKDINNGLVPIYNDDDVGIVVSGRKEHKLVVYIRMLTEDEVDDLVNSHIQAVQMEAEYNIGRSGVRIVELEDGHPDLATNKKSSGVLAIGWRDDWVPRISTPVIEDQSVSESPHRVDLQTEPDTPRASPLEDEDEYESDASVDLNDPDVDVYDDNDVQERFAMDKMWQDSEDRRNEPNECGADGLANHDSSGKRMDSPPTTANERDLPPESSPSRDPHPETTPPMDSPPHTQTDPPSVRATRSHKRKCRPEPEPADVDSDLETDDAAFSRRLVFGSDEEDDADASFPEFNRDIDMEKPEFQVGMIFTDLKEFKDACRSYAVVTRRPITFVPNDKRRAQCLCRQNCGFRVWASWLPTKGYAQIKAAKLSHSCGVEYFGL